MRDDDRMRTAPRAARLLLEAAQRLTDPRPAVAVAALRGLEMLGRDVALRQSIMDVLCARLRTPGPAADPLRTAVQRTIADRIRPGSTCFWGALTVDLTGAQLTDVDLSGCHVGGDLRLDGAVLLGQARFRHLSVAGATSLHGALFTGHAWFERSVLRGPARLSATRFDGDAWFGEVTFGAGVSFAAATFGGHAWFGGATFAGPAVFDEAMFRRSAGFRGAVARAGVRLTATTFLGPARVSRQGDDGWNIGAPGWRVTVDPDNQAVGTLLWAGHPVGDHTPV
jgi:hypothetical protein